MRDIKNVYTTSPLVGRDRACVLPCQFTIEMGLKWQPQQTAATGRHAKNPKNQKELSYSPRIKDRETDETSSSL